jgi:hypothetical protein
MMLFAAWRTKSVQLAFNTLFVIAREGGPARLRTIKIGEIGNTRFCGA